MPTHDVECSFCHEVILNHSLSPWPSVAMCPYCGGTLDILWTAGAAKPPKQVADSECIVVWEHPTTGEVAYPGRNDAPMPKRYADRGFARRELRTRHEAEQFERSHNVINEKLWYNSGNSWD